MNKSDKIFSNDCVSLFLFLLLLSSICANSLPFSLSRRPVELQNMPGRLKHPFSTHAWGCHILNASLDWMLRGNRLSLGPSLWQS